MDIIINVQLQKSRTVKQTVQKAEIPPVEKNRFGEDNIIVRDSFKTEKADSSAQNVDTKQTFSYIDITNIVESLRFQRSTKKDNQLDLRIKQEFINNAVDDDDLLIGSMIRFQYGFANKMSKVRIVEIVDLVPEWSERIKFTVIARDLGHSAKKYESNMIWKGKTSSEIAIAIAKKLHLKFKVDPTTMKWDDMPQGNKTDFELLRQLAKNEPGYSFFVQDDVLYFIKRQFSKKPIASYVYGGGELISFKVKARESQQETASNETTFIGINPMTGKVETSTSDNKKDANLGKKGIGLYSAGGDGAGTSDGFNNPAGFGSGGTWDEDKSGANKTMPDPTGDPSQMANSANAMQQDSLDSALKASFKVIGNPWLEIDELVSIGGIGKRFGGNWYMSDLVDEVSAGGYLETSGEVLKDGTGKDLKLNATDNTNDVNTKPGENGKKKKQIPLYDASGNPAGSEGGGSQGSF